MHSVILLSHEKPSTALTALYSVLHQSNPDWECLLIDSGFLLDNGLYHDVYDHRIHFYRDRDFHPDISEIRKTKNIASFLYNECFRNDLVSGQTVSYLCDDDKLYANAFELFANTARINPGQMAWYASEDYGALYPDGREVPWGERRAFRVGGKCVKGFPLDCVVDYLQFWHRPEVLHYFPDDEYWSENKADIMHADGCFMEEIGSFTPIYPIDVKVGMNRRTKESATNPLHI